MWPEVHNASEALEVMAAVPVQRSIFSREDRLGRPGVARALRTWRRLGPGQTRPPVPLPFLVLLVFQMALGG
eukprot:11224298-Lingulodinium_polyedra.AAC.1